MPGNKKAELCGSASATAYIHGLVSIIKGNPASLPQQHH